MFLADNSDSFPIIMLTMLLDDHTAGQTVFFLSFLFFFSSFWVGGSGTCGDSALCLMFLSF